MGHLTGSCSPLLAAWGMPWGIPWAPPWFTIPHGSPWGGPWVCPCPMGRPLVNREVVHRIIHGLLRHVSWLVSVSCPKVNHGRGHGTCNGISNKCRSLEYRGSHLFLQIYFCRYYSRRHDPPVHALPRPANPPSEPQSKLGVIFFRSDAQGPKFLSRVHTTPLSLGGWTKTMLHASDRYESRQSRSYIYNICVVYGMVFCAGSV